MIGADAIGFHAVGESISASGAPRIYEPVSRVIPGGFSSGRTPAVAELGADIIWDNDDLIVWDNDDSIDWT